MRSLITKPIKTSDSNILRAYFKLKYGIARNATEDAMMYKLGKTTTGFRAMANAYRELAVEYNVDAEVHNAEVEKKRRLKAIGRKIAKNRKIKLEALKISEPDLTKLRDSLQQYKGKSIVVEYIIDSSINTDELIKSSLKFEGETKLEYVLPKLINKKQVIKTIEYDVPQTGFRQWWKHEASHNWFYTYDTTLFEYYQNTGNVFIYPQKINIKTENIIQSFRDGVSHCVLTPIRNWATIKGDESKSKTAKVRYSGIINKLNKFEITYKDGVPEDCIAEICNECNIDIDIELPFAETKFIEGRSTSKKLKLFRFMNTRLNHIDLNEVVINDDPEIVSVDQLQNIQYSLIQSKEFFTYSMNYNNISSINTLTKSYKLSNEYRDYVGKFEIATGLNCCKIDDIGDFELSKFIRDGTNYNGTIDFQDVSLINRKKYEAIKDRKEIVSCRINGKEINHIDMTKAYANFNTCSFYSGFLGKITDYRQTDKIVGVGMYRITDIVFPEGALKTYNEKLNIYVNNNVYTSPELLMLTKHNVAYKVVSGCWGVKPLYFEFDDTMMNNKDDGIPYYSKWAGGCDQHSITKKFWMNGEEEYFKVIESECKDKVVKNYYNGSGCIEFPKKANYHLGHITAFITAYQRLNMLEQLMEFSIDNVVRVCVDGIYHTQDNVNLKNVFRPKIEKRFSNEACDSYVDKACKRELIINEPEYREHYATEVHLGCGGSGKTHHNLNDKGLIRPVFLAPSWKLAINKKNETLINSSVWARALSSDPERVSVIKQYSNVLIIDEISMLSETDKQKLFDTFSDMKIIMCGDIGYQLPCIIGASANKYGFDNIVRHTKNYRCQDPLLLEIFDKVRSMIDENLSKQEINKWCINKFTSLGRMINMNELQEVYNIHDMILSGTNEIKDYYTSKFAGKFQDEKYYITENNRMHCNGDIIIGDKPVGCKSEVRHCFTTHSIQGETAYNNLFIDSSKMFDATMFYTAISRAKRLDQIYIIQNEDVKFNFEYGKIYKIVSKNGTYIGSTIKKLEDRLTEHKKGYDKYNRNGGKYITSYKLIGDDDVKIEKIENFRCNSLKDLWKRESEIIQTYGKRCVNKTFNEWAE